MYLRDANGEYIAAKTVCFQGIPLPQEAEACSLKEVIIWLGNRGLMAVGCNQFVDNISNKFDTSSEL
jgi:hypothetical protein